jgi:putative mRNA 3-end processing factor
MRIRGTRRRKSVDKGFVLSDHADWDALNTVIRDTGAERIIVTHGYAAEMVRWLSEKGLQAGSLVTHFEGELAEMQPDSAQESEESDRSAAARVDAPVDSEEDSSS